MTLKELTAAIESVSVRYAQRYGIKRDIDWCMLKLTEELGELRRVHLKRSGQARVSTTERTGLDRAFEDELADVLGQLLVLASRSNVDLDAALDRKWLRWHPSRLGDEAYRDQTAA